MTMARRFAFVAILFFAATAVFAEQYPQPTGYVNDFANLLSHDQGASLNADLAAFEEKTSIEIAVVTVPWLADRSIEEYARGLATEWGVGKRSRNNGVVFLVAPKERKMRIETADGVRSILTDNRADQIRDRDVIPRFKAGDMAQGIIDGTHAIMRTLDANSSPVTGKEGTAVTSQSHSNEWTTGDTKVLLYVLGSIAGIALSLLLIVPSLRRSNARKFVLANKAKTRARIAEAEKLARSSDVKAETRAKLAELKQKFAPIDALADMSQGVDWIETRRSLEWMSGWFVEVDGGFVGSIISDIKRDIAFAEKARKEGPELMKKIPGMIEEAEKKLAEGKQSPKAAKYIKEARAEYARAQTQQAGMTVTDWIILYVILSSARSKVSSAESAHAGSDDYRSSSSRHSSSSGSHGYGSSSGFGGGGGFSGGGSSGSW